MVVTYFLLNWFTNKSNNFSLILLGVLLCQSLYGLLQLERRKSYNVIGFIGISAYFLIELLEISL
jgi:hypothetical protein